MKTIYKYQLKTTEQQTITTPVGSEILSLQIQNDNPCLWVKVDTNNEVGDRTFATFGTGYPLPDNPMEFVGTYQTGEFVFHVFEMVY